MRCIGTEKERDNYRDVLRKEKYAFGSENDN